MLLAAARDCCELAARKAGFRRYCVAGADGNRGGVRQFAASAFNLLILSLGLWVVSWWPANVLGSASGVRWMTVALLIVAIPGFINLLVSALPILQDPLKSMLAQMSLRVAVLLLAVLCVKTQWPQVGISLFYGWLMGFYLVSLTFESWEFSRLVRRRS
jgi:hypothetical protein